MAKGESKTLSFVDPEDWLTEERLQLLEGWSRDGYTFRDVANRIGISNQQLIKWRDNYPEISNALKKGREVVDYQVENALLKSALGFKTKEVTIITVLRNGKMVETTKQTVTKEIAPNVSACQTWLYNRLPDKWKNMNARSNILNELADEDSNISITVTRAGKNPVGEESSEEDKEWQESVNQSVSIRKKTEEEKKQERKEKAAKKKQEREQAKKSNTQIEDIDYWPDDWEDED